MSTDLREERESLWWLVVSPVIWLAHFLATYITVALVCRFDPTGIEPARVAIFAASLVAVAGVALTARRAHRRHRYEGAAAPHDFDTPEDRHRFIGFASLLLSGLSAAAIVYDTLAIVFVGRCG